MRKNCRPWRGSPRRKRRSWGCGAPRRAAPIGALLLEHCRIAKEEQSSFSISFSEEPDRKYYFECSSEEQCQEWVEALRRASYEFMRRSLIFYRNEIQKVTGKALSPDKKGSRSGALCPPLYRPNKLCLGKKKRKNAKGEIAFYFQEEKWKRSLILPISFQERTRKPKC
ncbi:pleckstrin homology domain-containing family J member 1 isoform X2 [Tachyglossus aculeatus]|uniref:pleckstrin homology domain-containing family J member 1 isoform X2 n=1 Tax=Tachyglossus aculeatus TaxID=9261 RepID=UPI0018F6FF7A|nr:pleckstrin homology domain-containing family J member 1 isoform X2 [Tachyglossus aculeatus]